MHLARRAPRAEPNEPRDRHLANVVGRTLDLELVDLVDEQRGEHTDNDLLLLIHLRQSVVQRVEVGSGQQRGELHVRSRDLVRRPESRQVIVPD